MRLNGVICPTSQSDELQHLPLNRTILAKSIFIYAGPKLWTFLDDSIRNDRSLNYLNLYLKIFFVIINCHLSLIQYILLNNILYCIFIPVVLPSVFRSVRVLLLVFIGKRPNLCRTLSPFFPCPFHTCYDLFLRFTYSCVPLLLIYYFNNYKYWGLQSTSLYF